MSGSIRVHELAKELKKSNREVADRLRRLGIIARTNLSSISQEDANRVRVSFNREPVKIEKPKKKKAAKKPAAKKPAAKKAAKKPAAKKPAAKKAAKKPAAKAAVPEPKAVSLRGEPAKPGPIEEKPYDSLKPKLEAVSPATPKQSQAEPAAGPKVGTRPLPKPGAPAKKAAKPEYRLAAGVPRPSTAPEPGKEKKTLKVAPPDRKVAPKKISERKVYKFVPTGRGAAPAAKSPPSTVAPKAIRVASGLTVKEFAQKAGLTPADVIKKMMEFGELMTLNQPMTDDAIRLLGEDLGVEIKIKAAPRQEELEEIADLPENLRPRPPVVTVMGHVDHGKTLLLDTIRKTDVISGEMGGITQHIGAYQVTYNGKPITFIDTPGHESFTAMRARGARMTDIAVLVVAADDGVMPQTLEALDHAIEAEVPVVVAVNKIDKPEADPHRVRQQLSERGMVPEEWGGDVVFVDVSAKEGTNIDHLLEMVLLIAELQELKANPDVPASGVVVEAKLERSRGPVATVLVQRGTARVGDVVVVGTAWGKIRAMYDDRGGPLEEAGPSRPVELLGLSRVPMAGDDFRVVVEEKKARQITDKRRTMEKLKQRSGPPRVSLDNLFDKILEGELQELKVVIKADTQGSLEAVLDSLEKIASQEIKLKVIHSGVGGISETDIMLASASDAICLGFNVRPDSKAARSAEAEKVEIRTYQVIYQLIEDMESAIKGMLAPEYEEEVTGRAEVRQLFRVPGTGTIAGSYVQEGQITRNSQIRVVRDGTVVYQGRVSSLKRFKDDVREVSSGYECGIGVEGFSDLKEGDILEVFELREVPR